MKKTLLFFLRISISAGILWYVFSRPDVNFSVVVESVKSMKKYPFVIGSALFFLIILTTTYRWKILLNSHGIRIVYLKALEYNFIGFFFNNMMPSLTGGDLVKVFYITRDTPKKAEAISTIAVDRFSGAFATLLLALFGSLMNLTDNALFPAALGVISVFIGVIVFVLLFLNRKLMKRLNIFRYFGKLSHIEDRIGRIYDALVFYRHDKKLIITVLGLSLIVQTIVIVINYLIALGLGMTGVGLWHFFMLIPIANIISAIPVSFAGWGIGEGAYKGLFSLATSGQGSLIVGLSIIVRLLVLAWSLVGLPVYLMNRPKEIETV